MYTQRQWKVTSKSHTLNIGQYLVHSERRTADTSTLNFYGIESHASPLWRTVSITPECILIIPLRTPVVSIALDRKMQSFGATLKLDPHLSRLMG